jgi:hypothetical protein
MMCPHHTRHQNGVAAMTKAMGGHVYETSRVFEKALG